METIIIDENYKGVKKVGDWFEIDSDISFPEDRDSR